MGIVDSNNKEYNLTFKKRYNYKLVKKHFARTLLKKTPAYKYISKRVLPLIELE